MNNLQKQYQNKVGNASVNIKDAVAGELKDFEITFNVGETGIDDSGAIKVLFRIVTDGGVPQFENPDDNNFVSFSSSNKEIEFIGISNAKCFIGKIHTRPWCKGLKVVLKNNHMSKGDQIKIKFKNWDCQTVAEEFFQIKFLVDPFATNKFIEVPNKIGFKIFPNKPENLKIISKNNTKDNNFKTLIKIEDRFGNVCTNIKNKFVDVLNIDSVSLNKSKFKLKNGCVRFSGRLNSEIGFVEAKFENLNAISNPIVRSETNHFWADLHGQTEETVGQTSIDNYINFAKKFSLLDVVSHQANDFQVSNQFWKKINKLSDQHTKDNKFIFLAGYEWSGNTSNGGDHNVIFRDTKQKISRSSHALVDDFSDIKSDSHTIRDLFKKLDSKNSLVISHVGGRFASLDVKNEKLRRLIEVHSVWGTFEWILFEALEKDFKIGIVANSDGHHGRPGSSAPGLSEFNNFGGLTCILADSFDRDTIFNALRNRSCYATTGARIFIDKKITINNKELSMGNIVKIKKNKLNKFKLDARIVGTDHIDAVHIFNGTNIIKSIIPNTKNKDTGIKLLWSGSKVKGRNRKIEWRGSIKSRNKIEILNKINFFNPSHQVFTENNKLEFNGATTGGDQGLIFKVNNDLELELEINGRDIKLEIDKIDQSEQIIKFPGLDASVKISKVIVNTCEKDIKIDEFLLLNSENNKIFLKVVQRDGHMAWTSPIYVN